MTANTANKAYLRIWTTVMQIPTGTVASYGQIADLAGLPGRARLVGKSLSNRLDTNTIRPAQPLPWHRVLRSNGHLAFPKGSEQALIQTGLLQEEGVSVLNNRVSIKQFGWQPDLFTLLHKLTF